MRSKPLVLFLLLPLLLQSGQAAFSAGQEKTGSPAVSPESDQRVIIDALQKRLVGEELMELRGDVEIRFGKYRFFTDFATFNLKTKEVRAPGRVTIYSPGNTLVGANLTFDIDSRQGQLTDVYGFIPPSVFYRGEVVTQNSDEQIDYRHLTFSSCNQVVPLWSLRSSRGRLVKDRYIRMNDVVFRIKKVPVFYLPVLQYPIREGGRSTGFLFPNIGNSKEKGLVISNQFFWAPRPDLDFTLGFDHFAQVGNGFYGEARWLFQQFEGNARYYQMFHKLDEEGLNVLNKKRRYDYLASMEVKKRFQFWNTEVIANVNRQSDPNFLRIFSKAFASQITTSFSSLVGLNSTVSDTVHLTARVSENQTYLPSQNYSSLNRALPVVNLRVSQQKIGKIPGYFSFDLGYQNTLRSGENYLDSEIVFNKGEYKPRIAVNPVYTVDVIKLPYLSASLKYQGDYHYEFKSLNPETGDIASDPILTSSNKLLLNLTGPVLYRNYATRRTRLKHMIEPSLTYRYALTSDNINNTLKVNASDYPDYSYLQFGFSTRLVSTPKNEDPSRDILKYSLSQYYYFDPQLASRNRKVNGEYPRFSELSNRLEFSFHPSWNFDSTVNYNYYLDEFTTLRFRLKYQYSETVQGSLFYNKDRNQYTAPDWLLNRATVGGSLLFTPDSVPFSIISNINYDLTDQNFRFARILGAIKLQCVRINVEVLIRKNLQNEIIPEFTVGISLGNLGAVKDLLGGDL